MDVNLLVSSLQLTLAAIQLKLDHFTRPSNRQNEEELDRFNELGEAIRMLEYALAETVSFVGQMNNRSPNPRLASLWADASISLRRIQDGADLADLTFEKNLYWRNPDFFRGQDENKLYRISLGNVLEQLRKLRGTYDKLQRKIYG